MVASACPKHLKKLYSAAKCLHRKQTCSTFFFKRANPKHKELPRLKNCTDRRKIFYARIMTAGLTLSTMLRFQPAAIFFLIGATINSQSLSILYESTSRTSKRSLIPIDHKSCYSETSFHQGIKTCIVT